VRRGHAQSGLHDTTQHPEAELLAGCTILRFDAPLIFANASTFRDRVPPPGLPPEPTTDAGSRAGADPVAALAKTHPLRVIRGVTART
jgi:hypothetical protein